MNLYNHPNQLIHPRCAHAPENKIYQSASDQQNVNTSARIQRQTMMYEHKTQFKAHKFGYFNIKNMTMNNEEIAILKNKQ